MSSIVLVRTQIRPNTSVEWFKTPSSVLDYINATYLFNVGNLEKTEVSTSADNLTLEIKNTWTSMEANEAFRADPIIAANLANWDAYNAANNITVILGQE